jgi:hypothetical protein
MNMNVWITFMDVNERFGLTMNFVHGTHDLSFDKCLNSIFIVLIHHTVDTHLKAHAPLLGGTLYRHM